MRSTAGSPDAAAWARASGRGRAALVPYLFILPAFAGLAVFKLWPTAEAVRQSLMASGVVLGTDRFTGWSNYVALGHSPAFWHSLGVTALFSLIINPAQTAAALALALLVFRPGHGAGLFRTLFFLPMTVSIVIASLIWQLILDPHAGLANSLLAAAGLPPQPFLTSPRQALPSIVAMATWKGAGYWMMFVLAGLTQIPAELFEAAGLDGAGAWQTFRWVTLPLLRRVLTFVLVADTAVNVLMFAPVYLLTLGGPVGSTDLLMFETYQTAFRLLDLGRASAMAMVILALVLLVAAAEMRLLRAGDAP